MAELKDRLRADLNNAMRARDQVRMRTLRMALTSITNEEVAGSSARDLSDEEVVKVLTREARKRREAAEAFGAAGRAEQAAAERAEGDVLADYLPAQLGDDELYVAFPGAHLSTLLEKLATILDANRVLKEFHQSRLAASPPSRADNPPFGPIEA